ncbi:MAG: response regulator transcription factor [Dehalococcoidia bacterium]|nr:response regulator transcription factor [Dehalococcoidia bacterium]
MDSTDSSISVLLIDDHPLFRDAVKRVLDRHAAFKVVAESGDGYEAVHLAATLRPKVAILDIGLRGLTGLEVVRKMKAESPETAILVLTVHDDAEHVRSMLQGGASGFLTKDVLGGEIIEAIHRVAAGEIYLCPVALKHVVDTAISEAPVVEAAGAPKLTGREYEVLTLLAQGLSNSEIASRLGLSTRTVKGHLEELFAKLEVDSRTSAVTKALRVGILGVQDL